MIEIHPSFHKSVPLFDTVADQAEYTGWVMQKWESAGWERLTGLKALKRLGFGLEGLRGKFYSNSRSETFDSRFKIFRDGVGKVLRVEVSNISARKLGVYL